MSLVALRVLTPENQLKGILLPDIDAWNAKILRKKVLKVDNCQRCRVFLVFGARALRDAHMVTFFFRRFRDMCQLFKLVRQISQNPEQIRTPCFR